MKVLRRITSPGIGSDNVQTGGRFEDERGLSVGGMVMMVSTYGIGTVIAVLGNTSEAFRPVLPVLLLAIANMLTRMLLYGNARFTGKYVMISTGIELILLTYMSTVDRSGACFIFYMVTISETTIAQNFKSGIFVALWVIVISTITRTAGESSLDIVLSEVAGITIGVLFTFVMSYLVKLQFIEKLKLAKVNRELEQAYGKMIENAAKAQELSLEKERLRMAREIHDTLAHTLTAAIVQMEAAKKLMDVDSVRAKEEIEKAQEVTREGLSEVKRTIKALRPQKLENSSFIEALNSLAEETKRNTGVEILLVKNISEGIKLPANVDIVLFRVIQESLTNSIRHGAANNISISIESKESSLLTEISDDGRGCSHIKKGYGLLGITERIEALKGSVEFSSTPGKGFRTRMHIPVKGGSDIEN